MKFTLLGVILAVFFVFSLRFSAKWQEEHSNQPALGAIDGASGDASLINRGIYEKSKESIVSALCYQDGASLEKKGTGVVIGPHLVMTNFHVVSPNAKVVVVTWDGRSLPAVLAGTDEENDLALLRVSVPLQPFSSVVSENPEPGDEVLSLSRIGDGELFMSRGIVGSVTNPVRDGAGALVSGFLASDTVIINGASGSALLDMSGALAGINYAVYSDRTSRGLSYSLPARFALAIADKIIEDGGTPIRGGVDFFAADLSVDARLNPEARASGVAVTGFPPDSVSSEMLRTGNARINIGDSIALVGGDIVVELNGFEIRRVDDIYTSLALTRPGDKVSIGYIRDGKLRQGEITLAERKPGYEKRFIRR